MVEFEGVHPPVLLPFFGDEVTRSKLVLSLPRPDRPRLASLGTILSSRENPMPAALVRGCVRSDREALDPRGARTLGTRRSETRSPGGSGDGP